MRDTVKMFHCLFECEMVFKHLVNAAANTLCACCLFIFCTEKTVTLLINIMS